MRFILISLEGYFEQEHIFLNQIFQKGLLYFHLRKPTWSFGEQEIFLNKINPIYHSRIVLHDHYELIKKFNLKGIHYNTRNKTSFNQCETKNLKLSGSFHQFHEIEKFPYPLEYGFLSPVFDSISKDFYKSDFEKSNLKFFLQKHKNIIALGGVNSSNINTCYDLGFRGVAILGAIWHSKNPLKSFNEIKKICKKYDNMP